MATLGSKMSALVRKDVHIETIIEKPYFTVIAQDEAVYKPSFVVEDAVEVVVKPSFVVQEQTHVVVRPHFQIKDEQFVIKKPVVVEEIQQITITKYNLITKTDWVLPGIMLVSAIAHIWSILK